MAERLNFREACQHAGVSRQRLNQAISSGRLPAERGGGPGKPTYIQLEDLQAWCLNEGLALPINASERLERVNSIDAAGLMARFEEMFQGMERIERTVEQALGRLERSQAKAIEQGMAQLAVRLNSYSPPPHSDQVSQRSKTPSLDRQNIIGRIYHAKDVEGKSYQQIANELNNAGTPTFSGRGTWQKGSVERVYKGSKKGGSTQGEG